MSSQRQELAQRIEEYRGVMALIDEGAFQLRTLAEARALAAALGSACGDPDAASLGLVELLVNAIEHGNLGISFEEKAALVGAGRWEAEVAARQARPENGDKAVRVACRRVGPDLVITISDEGGGFDWQRFLTLDQSRAFHPNGRGISLARQVAFARLEYLGRGNEVRVSLPARRAEAGAAGHRGQRRAA
jgi:anti-sigma regulatory factor (Ser/Thr protein kinase)